MTTSTTNFKINGVLDTNQNVLANLETLASAAGAWLTYDITQGKWSVIINTTGSSVASFDDSNIIGGINVSSTGLTELYNSVEIEFPHADIKDRKDFIRYDIASEERYANEPDNLLQIKFDCINDPIQAAAIASRELKQSRIDKIIEFRTDYSYLGLRAGDLIDITNDVYGFVNKVFRIIRIEEQDDDDTFTISISALEYDSLVYDVSGLTRTDRFIDNTIVNKNNNDTVQDLDDQDWTSVFGRMLLTSALTGLINSAFSRDPLTGKITQLLTNKTPGQRAEDVFTSSDRANVLKNIKNPPISLTGPSEICEGATLTIGVTADAACVCLIDTSTFELDYTISGIQSADTTTPLTGKVKIGANISIPISVDALSESETLTVTVGSTSKTVTIYDQLSYTYSTSASPTSITEGASSTVTLTTTGVADGTVVPYTITGDGTARVSTSLTGNVTVNSNTATLTVNTSNDSTYTGNQTVTVTFNSAQSDPCGQLDKTTVITIVDNETAPTTCQTVSIPIVWCPTYEGTTGQVTGLTVVKSATVPAPVSGGSTLTVPTAVSVTKGNPSTVTITSTTTIDATAGKAGQQFSVITAFNTIAPNGVVTGTTSTIVGY